MSDRQTAQPVPVTRIIQSTRVVMYVQVVLGLAGGVVLLTRPGSGETGPLLLALAALVIALVLLACAVRLGRREPWARQVAFAVEAVLVVGGVVDLVSGLATGGFEPLSVVPVALGLLVVQPLVRPDVKAWFATAS